MKKSKPVPDYWQLKRQDDHGNRYVVAAFNSEEEARKAMALYEGKGHKQTYWIENVGATGWSPLPRNEVRALLS